MSVAASRTGPVAGVAAPLALALPAVPAADADAPD